jgi:hypothetical protein
LRNGQRIHLAERAALPYSQTFVFNAETKRAGVAGIIGVGQVSVTEVPARVGDFVDAVGVGVRAAREWLHDRTVARKIMHLPEVQGVEAFIAEYDKPENFDPPDFIAERRQELEQRLHGAG